MAKPFPHDALSPDASPSVVSKKFGVRRVNNMPLYLAGTAITLFLIVMMSVAMDRARQKETTNAAKDPQGDASQLVAAITGNRTGGFVPAADATEPAPVLGLTVPIAMPDDDLDKPPLPPRLKANVEADPETDRIHQEKMQLFENAVRGKTGVSFTDKRPAPNQEDTLKRLAATQQRLAVKKDDLNNTFITRLAQLQGKDTSNTAPIASNDTPSVEGKNDRWQQDSAVEAPKTPYTLRAGFIIPASLISGINSELPGQIIGQISQNVYDTATGKYLLLPQGSRLVGTYSSDVSYGQSRVMIAWQRIIFPDGKVIDIGSMPGADGAGYSGFNDQVDNHYLRIFGSAILMSGISAGATLSQNNSASNIYGQPSASSALSEALGQQLGNITSQMISKNLNVSPTLQIRPGFRFNVMCVKDLVLDRPYASFDY